MDIKIHNIKMYNNRQLREVFHFCFLEKLLKISYPNLYIVKGGVNLRFFFNSPRYSEDMDIDVIAGNVTTLKKNGYKILEDASFKRSLRVYGIEELIINDPLKAKQTETTQRFRVNLVTRSNDKLPTKVEFSRRPKEKLKYHLETIKPDIARGYQKLSFRCQHYDGESAAIQKVYALAGRNEPQTRDIFDLNILYLGGFLNPEEIKKIPKNIREKAKNTIEQFTYLDFEGQVLEFLEESIKKEYKKKDTWDELKSSIFNLL